MPTPSPKPVREPKQPKGHMTTRSRKKPASEAEKWYAERMAHLPCWCCGQYGAIELHHCYYKRMGSRKKNMYSMMPMLIEHHKREYKGSLHYNHNAFFEKHGPDYFGIIDTLIKIWGDRYSEDH